jgi:hypothetical protein
MTRIEKQMVAGIVFLLIAIALFSYNVSRVLTPALQQVEEKGLKSVVMPLWEGKGK